MAQPWNLGPPVMEFSGLANIGSQFTSAYDKARKRVVEEETTADFLKAFDASQGAAAPAATTPPLVAPSAAASGDYFAKTAQAESGGSDVAKNPNSTATGRYQFLAGTWNDLAAKRPDLGLTPAGRTDPQQQDRAMRAFTEENAKVLQAKGIQPTDGNLYMAHFLGAGAAPNFIAATQQDPSVPATSLVSPQVAAANRPVFFNKDGTPKTAGEVYQRMAGRFGSGSTAVAGATPAAPVQMAQAGGPPVADMPAEGAAPAQGFAVPGAQPATRQNVNGAMIRALVANPETRATGLQLWQQAQKGTNFGFQMIGDQLYRTNPQTGTAELVPGVTNPGAALDQKSKALDIAKKERDLQGEGGRPMTAEERSAYNVKEGQPAWMKRDGSPGFGPAGTSITNANTFDGKGESKFNEALGAAQAKRWNGYIEEGDVAQSRIADIQTLRETSRRLGSQGSSANLKATIGPYAESLGIKVDGLDDIQLYESITNRLAPTLRAAGSGSTSDIEFKGFQRAIGPLSNTPAAREMILDTFEAASRNDIARSEIASRLAEGQINRQQAEKEIRSLPNPLDGFRKFREANPDVVGQAIKDSVLQARDDRKPVITPPSPEAARKLPSGTRIKLPDGSIGVVP